MSTASPVSPRLALVEPGSVIGSVQAPPAPTAAERAAGFHVRILDARSTVELGSILVNELARVLSFAQASFLVGKTFGPSKIVAVSNLIDVDQSSPYCVWIRRAYRRMQPLTEPALLSPGNGPAKLDSWEKFAPPFVLVAPLLRGRVAAGALVLARHQPWTDAEVQQVASYMRTAAAAIALQDKGLGRVMQGAARRWKRAVAAGLIALGMLFPIRLASVAPAEIVPETPETVSSALSGSVKRVLVSPNQPVKAGDVLVLLDDTERRSKLQIAEGELRLAETEVRRLTQLGFQDPSSRAKIADAQGQVELRKLDREYAALDLERTTIRSSRDGIAVVSDPAEWQGRPVQVGERIMLVADPNRVSARLWVPAADGGVLETFSSGRLFLDTDPWRSRPLQLTYWSFEPEQSPQGVMAYRVKAEVGDGEAPRIGLRGTAHLEGERVAFSYYVFRRVVIFLRQKLAF